MARAEEAHRLTVEEIEREAMAAAEEQDDADDEGMDEEIIEEAEEEQLEEEPAEETENLEEAEAESEAQAKMSWREIMDKVDWTGYDQAKIDEVDPHLASQRQYYSRVINEALQAKREYEEKLAAAGKQVPAQEKAAAPEEDILEGLSFNDDEGTFKQRLREAIRREAEKISKQQGEAIGGKVSEIEKRLETERQESEQRRLVERAEEIKRLADNDPEIIQQIQVILNDNPEFEGPMLRDDNGARYVIRMAKGIVEERRNAAGTLERKASAKDRAITKPTPKGAAKNTKKAITGDSMEDIARALAESDEFRDTFGPDEY